MAETRSSLKEFENFSRHMGSYITQIEQNLNEYKNQVNNVIDTTLGGTQVLAGAALDGVMKSLKDLESKYYDLQDFLKKASESKSNVTQTTAQDAQNITY